MQCKGDPLARNPFALDPLAPNPQAFDRNRTVENTRCIGHCLRGDNEDRLASG